MKLYDEVLVPDPERHSRARLAQEVLTRPTERLSAFNVHICDQVREYMHITTFRIVKPERPVNS